ncbi:MAG: DNA mismatch repair protein MutS, partial [Firmicutes bacterium]|nr:DNA mismatch repair protein MutS [Bacillota bacterium]
LNRVINCSIQVSEKEGEVTFLYKIVPGGSDRSYGIHVAKLAGLPEELVSKAKNYVAQESWGLPLEVPVAATRERLPAQVESILGLLQSLNLEDISPRQAWTELDRLVRLAAEVSANED